MLTVPFVLLVLGTFVSLAALICHLAVPPLLRLLTAVNPGLRSHLLLMLAAAPWLIGASVLVSSIGDILFDGCDFSGSCLWNEDPQAVDPVRALVVVPLLLATMMRAGRAVFRQIASHRLLTALDATGDIDSDPAIRIIPSDQALAFAGKGRIYVSRAVSERLSPDQYRALILHEKAHLQRHDGLFQSVAGILTACYLPPLRWRILTALALANEQACDEQAAASVGPTHVAAAILAVERMNGIATASPLPGFADSFVPARVHRLLNREQPKSNVGLLRAVVVTSILLAFLGCDILYYTAMMILYPRA